MVLLVFTRSGPRANSQFTIFTQTIMHLVYPENFAYPLASICITEENWKLSSCKICRGGAKQGALWSMWKWWICEGHSTLVFSLLLTSGRSFRQTSTRKRDLGYDIEDTRLWGLAQSPFLQLKACVKALGWETRKVISGYGAWGNRTKNNVLLSPGRGCSNVGLRYPQDMDSAIGFPNTYPLDSDLSGGLSN